MYYVVYGPLYLLSLLPLRVLYLFADFAYLVIYYLLGYRKKVVRDNLQIAFPGKTATERKRIEKRFYKNFADSFLETIKAFSASNRFINEHFPATFLFLKNCTVKVRNECRYTRAIILIGNMLT